MAAIPFTGAPGEPARPEGGPEPPASGVPTSRGPAAGTESAPSVDDLQLLLEVMPPPIRAAVEASPRRPGLIEIVLDLGRIPEARFPERVDLSSEPVSMDEIRHVVERVGRFGNDNRAGIERTLHRISALRNRVGEIIGLTCRAGRAVRGTVDIVRDVIERGDSVLILGRPGVGKTTLLREAARVLADELDKRVVVVDTSNEIAGDGNIPHPGIGRARRLQVPSPAQQHAVMIEAVENHMPEVVVIDEIGTEAEAQAARTIAERGVQLVATAHGNTLDNLMQNPTLADLVGGIQSVTLSDEEARRRGTQKTVLERKAPPTFDALIEIHEKDRLAVHHDVAEVVDRMLRGSEPRPELRVRTEGGVRIEPADAEGPGPAPPSARPPVPPRRARPAETFEDAAVVEVPPTRSPRAGDQGRPRPLVRIFPFALSRARVERAIREMGVAARLVERADEADLVLTLKSHARRQPGRLRQAVERGLRLETVRSNTLRQIEEFLRREFGRDEFVEVRGAALRDVEDAIAAVLRTGEAVELPARQRPLRRLQHELAQRSGLATESRGEEPGRRVVIYPP
jgi:stage III sporulation protein SpoIIIAA